jgi:hypothetical protein
MPEFILRRKSDIIATATSVQTKPKLLKFGFVLLETSLTTVIFRSERAVHWRKTGKGETNDQEHIRSG